MNSPRRQYFRLRWFLTGLCCAVGSLVAAPDSPLVPVGVASVDISPSGPVRLQGFPHRGRQQDLDAIALRIKARALAIGGDKEGPVLLVTADLLGVSAAMKADLLSRLTRRVGFGDPARLSLTASHTHSAPAITDVAPYIFRTPPTAEQVAHLDQYRAELMDRLEEVALAALADRQSARLRLHHGELDFAVNRRELTEGRWTGFGVNPAGPTARQMPMITITDPAGKLRAVWANYACHGVNWIEPSVHSDWIGEAEQQIEARHAGVVALVTIGCAGDQNPTGIHENQAANHGATVANEIDRRLAESGRPLEGPPVARLREFALPLAAPLPEEVWEQNPEHWFSAVVQTWREQGKPLPTTVPYVAHTWVFGEDLTMVFLAGEVVLDYALRLRRERNDDTLWVTAYANDAPAYIPSRRMLIREGGYEVDASRLTYGVPTRFDPETEDRIVAVVQELLADKFDPEDNNK